MGWTDARDPSLNLPADALALVEHARECDAHALWACLSDFDCYLHLPDAAGGRRLQVLVELEAAATQEQREAIAQAIGKPSAYDIDEDFWTGTLARGDLLALHAMPGVSGWRLGLPLVRDSVAGETAPAGPVVAAAPIDDQLPLTDIDPALPVVGLIDHGIAVAHAAFRLGRGGAQPRVLALWDQDPHRCNNGNWQPVPELGYGGELGRRRLAGLIAAIGDDERIYEALGYPPAQHRISHGTHVLDLAAGDPSPLTPPDLLTAQGHDDWSGPASRAGIVAVQLPWRPHKDTSGGSLCVHVPDALHYIVGRTRPGTPVVVNLSDGAYGGPHDGQSMLERALDHFLQRHRAKVLLVLAAGNAQEDRGHVRSVPLTVGEHSWRWQVMPDDPTPSFAEIWFNRELAGDEAVLSVCSPLGQPTHEVKLTDAPQLLVDAEGGVAAAVIPRISSPNARGRSMFLLALAPTARQRAGRPVAPHGHWTLTVRSNSKAALRAEAWVERDGPALNDSGPLRQSYFVDESEPSSVDRQRTLGSLAGSGRAIVVGGRYRRGTAFGDSRPGSATQVARYSSLGPGREGATLGPDLVAPSDESPAAPGLRAAGSRSGASVCMNGTSVAAPLVTRRIVNVLAANPAALQSIKQVLVPSPVADPLYDGRRGEVVPGQEP